MEVTQLSQTYKDILKYLMVKHPNYVSPSEIGVEVGGVTKSGIKRHSAWASPKMKKLVSWGFVERSSNGHYKVSKALV